MHFPCRPVNFTLADCRPKFICISQLGSVFHAVFDLTKSTFSFVVNPDLDSLANRLVWICRCCQKWRHRYLVTFVMLLSTSGFAGESMSKLDSLDSRIQIRVRAVNGWIHCSLSNLNPDSDSANRIRPHLQSAGRRIFSTRWAVVFLIWPWTLMTCDLDIQTAPVYGQGEPACQRCRSKII